MSAAPGGGRLADNVMHFARLLRAAGLPVGTDRVQLALAALQVAGLDNRVDCHTALAACLVDRHAHQPLFDQAFDLFWRAPDEAAGGLPLPAEPDGNPPVTASAAAPDAGPPAAPLARRRLPGGAAGTDAPPDPQASGADAAGSWSAEERLRQADFDTLDDDGWRRARQWLARLPPLGQPLPTRRTRAARQPGRPRLPDWRATLSAMGRHGAGGDPLRWRQRRQRPAPLVLLADVSGSMRRYARMLLHFGHALAQGDTRVESFVFGTRLTRISRLLKQHDPDRAVGQVVRTVPDWSGGTRLAECLHDFNQHWARRVLDSRATVVLVTDGLAHGEPAALAAEMARLRRSCRRLVWLNPLLRYAGFQPRARGIQAMLPHVDRFVPAHNLDSLAALVRLLAEPAGHDPARAPTRITAATA